MITVGKVLSAHGVEGEVSVASLTEVPERFAPGSHLQAVVKDKPRSLTVAAARPGKGVLLVKFEGIEQRDAAEELSGAVLQIDEAALKGLPPDTYWRHQIIGLNVYTDEGVHLGVVTRVLETGANDVYVVGRGTEEIMIPAIKQVVKEVRLEEKKMIVRLMPGLK